MSHVVWIACDVADLVREVQVLLRPHGIVVETARPADAPDLIVSEWVTRDAVLPGLADAESAAPPAQVYVVGPESVPDLLAQPLTDPLADALPLPLRAADLALAITRSLGRRDQYLNLRAGLGPLVESGGDGGIVGDSLAMKQAIALARQVASSPATSVLIQGESGTGKDLLARLIHALTPGRRHRPFVDLNCAAIPSEMLEAELFGFERGAFTNASRDKAGLMELAHGGTLFLDELGELNVGLQAKLLRVLETGTFRRLGGVAERRSDCRVIASTNRNLLDAVQHGLFRLDLYHRLAVFTIQTPTLRERRDDIMPMARHFLQQFAASARKTLVGFSPTAQALLVGYPYPGNVRELRNIIERAVIVTAGPVITPKDLGLELALMADTAPAPIATVPIATGPLARVADPPPLAGAVASPGWQQTLAEQERHHIAQVLAGARGNRALAARLLQISIPTLYKKIRKYNLETVGR